MVQVRLPGVGEVRRIIERYGGGQALISCLVNSECLTLFLTRSCVEPRKDCRIDIGSYSGTGIGLLTFFFSNCFGDSLTG